MKNTKCSGIAKLVRQHTVNVPTGSSTLSPRAIKYCTQCKCTLPVSEYYKHGSRKDGLQNHCKSCQKTLWGKKFICESCGVSFEIKHRNIARRKTRLCSKCAFEVGKQKTIERNKENATYVTYNKKGYKFIFLQEKNKYVLEHRHVMEQHLKRALEDFEVVHHIDTDLANNKISNLWLCSHSAHKKAHVSILRAAIEAIKDGRIKFNKAEGIYQ